MPTRKHPNKVFRSFLILFLVLTVTVLAFSFIACDGDDDEIKSCTLSMSEYDISICVNTNDEKDCKDEGGNISKNECDTAGACIIDSAQNDSNEESYLTGTDLTIELCNLFNGTMQ